MGKKSRLKKERADREAEEMIQQPVQEATMKFLTERGVDKDQGSELRYLVSMIVNFRIYRSIKNGIQLPVVKPREEELDESRLQELHRELANVCADIGVGLTDVVDDLVAPLSEDEKLVEQVLKKNYDLLGSLVDSESFREMTDGQIENAEAWGDNLSEYDTRHEEYFEAIRALFSLDLAVVRSDVDPGTDLPDMEKKLREIQEKYDLGAEDLAKLRRRATEFLRAAFANYLDIDFQRVRRALDTNLGGVGSLGNEPIQ